MSYALAGSPAPPHRQDTVPKSRPENSPTHNVNNVQLIALVVLRRKTYLIYFYNERKVFDEGTTSALAFDESGDLAGP